MIERSLLVIFSGDRFTTMSSHLMKITVGLTTCLRPLSVFISFCACARLCSITRIRVRIPSTSTGQIGSVGSCYCFLIRCKLFLWIVMMRIFLMSSLLRSGCCRRVIIASITSYLSSCWRSSFCKSRLRSGSILLRKRRYRIATHHINRGFLKWWANRAAHLPWFSLIFLSLLRCLWIDPRVFANLKLLLRFYK